MSQTLEEIMEEIDREFPGLVRSQTITIRKPTEWEVWVHMMKNFGKVGIEPMSTSYYTFKGTQRPGKEIRGAYSASERSSHGVRSD